MKTIKTFKLYNESAKATFTMKEYEIYLKDILSTNISGSRKGLKIVYHKNLYKKQPLDGNGFDKNDIGELNRIYYTMSRTGMVSDIDQQILFNKIPKYWAQILTRADKDLLHKSMNNGRQLKMDFK
jgi:hypothetical protein